MVNDPFYLKPGSLISNLGSPVITAVLHLKPRLPSLGPGGPLLSGSASAELNS